MASAMTVFKKMDVSTGVGGVGGVLLDGAVGAGASYMIGRGYVRYHDKWYGKAAPRIMAAAGKGGAILLSYLSGGHANLGVGIVNSIGQAGLNATALEYGLRHERAKQGKKALLVPKDTSTKAIKGAEEITALGALGKAAPGRGMSWDQIEELAAGR